jgi:hypothetical protein
MSLAVVFHAVIMVDVPSSVLSLAIILLLALKPHASLVNGATTVPAVLPALLLVVVFLKCAASAP